MVTLRFIISALGFYACGLMFSHRAGLSVAIVSMVRPPNITETGKRGSCFPANFSHVDEENRGSGQYDWSEPLQGVILGASSYSYLITVLLSGWAADRFGAKWILAAAVFLPGLLSAAIPLAADIHVGLLIAVQVLIGAGNGCVYSALFSLYANWFPVNEKSFALGSIGAGVNVGLTVMFIAAGYLCKYGFAGGWPSVFYVTAMLHLPWIVLWLWLVDDCPEVSKRIDIDELKMIMDGREKQNSGGTKAPVPWKAIATSKPVWASCTAKLTESFGFYLLLAKMPGYLDAVFGISIHHNGIFNSLTHLATAILELTCGPFSEWVRRKTSLSKTRVRKLFEIVGLLGPAACLAIVPQVGCDANAVVMLMIGCMLLYGVVAGGDWPIVTEFAPDFAGTLCGITNVFSISMAFVAPVVVGLFLTDNPGDKKQWNAVFYLTVAVYAVGAVVYELFASADPQPWGIVKKQIEINGKEHEENGIVKKRKNSGDKTNGNDVIIKL